MTRPSCRTWVTGCGRGILTAAGLGVVLACGRFGAPISEQGHRTAQVLVTPNQEWEVPEHEIERRFPRGRQLQVLGFGSGGGITALVTQIPRRGYTFFYDSPSRGFDVGRDLGWSPHQGVSRLTTTTPSSIVGVTVDGFVLILDQNTSAVGVWGAGGGRLLIAGVLDSLSKVQAACAPDARTVIFLESASRDTVRFQSLGQAGDRVGGTVLSANGNANAPWETATLTGLMGAGCVLWAPSWREVVPIPDTTLGAPWVLRWSSRRPPMLSRIVHWFHGSRQPAPVITRDITVFPGGIAVLPSDGKAIDLYSFADGRYLETLALPRPALRIAGAPNRLFVLSQAQDSILLASYTLPLNARALAPDGWQQERTDEPVPAWLRLLRSYAR